MDWIKWGSYLEEGTQSCLGLGELSLSYGDEVEGIVPC